jgi:AcrR family transcriptional regulator
MAPRPSVEEERRSEILQAALTCFARKGYDRTTMDEIAAELPFSKGLLYYYFKSKRELFLALLQDWATTSVQTWETLLSSEDDPTARLHKSAEFATQLLASSADLARVEMEFWGQLGREPDAAEAFREIFAEFRQLLANVIHEGIADGQFRRVNAEALAAALVGMYDGLALQAIVQPDAFDWVQVGETIVEVVLNGLKKT